MVHDPFTCPFCKAGVPLAKPRALLKIKTLDGKPVDGPTYISVSPSVAEAFAKLGRSADAARAALDNIDPHLQTLKDADNG